jgi:hypothetical protein
MSAGRSSLRLDDPAKHRHGAIPIRDVEHRNGAPRVSPHVTQAQPLEVHVDEDPAVLPVVPGRGRVQRPVRADGRDDRSVRSFQELNELVWQRRLGIALGLLSRSWARRWVASSIGVPGKLEREALWTRGTTSTALARAEWSHTR